MKAVSSIEMLAPM